MSGKSALYLSGGGARGAYQVGVLQAMRDILSVKQLPTEILSSVSVGSINAAYLAQYADDFKKACDGLNHLWTNLRPKDVYHTNTVQLVRSIFRNLRSFVFHVEGNGFLLNAEPLKALLKNNLDFRRIAEQINRGLCELDVATINYEEKSTISYYQSQHEYPQWQRMRHRAEKVTLSEEHILASSALPLFFEPISLDGAHHGDGGLRLSNPLRAAIKMGANKILVISNRQSSQPSDVDVQYESGISFANLFGQMLNALFLDNLDRDIRQIQHINQATNYLSSEEQESLQWHSVDVLAIKPSEDIGALASKKKSLLPKTLRYLLGSLGERKQLGDILSFLLFDGRFCRELIELGFSDAMQNKDDIKQFFD